ncbi:hypothetical protein B0H10DRAFT_1943161 [Mycena sp. CBHHK59/15]|nr:hypothetical protein B0H10DRAFT_1952444 [Mycena sp. CBHHK59/15]KAJ6624561.1 hypothetical protein B0H10DRAFT_1943161 [Mycena sp. CBHHK59/15]
MVKPASHAQKLRIGYFTTQDLNHRTQPCTSNTIPVNHDHGIVTPRGACSVRGAKVEEEAGLDTQNKEQAQQHQNTRARGRLQAYTPPCAADPPREHVPPPRRGGLDRRPSALVLLRHHRLLADAQHDRRRQHVRVPHGDERDGGIAVVVAAEQCLEFC